jgi:hypothetical protein
MSLSLKSRNTFITAGFTPNKGPADNLDRRSLDKYRKIHL